MIRFLQTPSKAKKVFFWVVLGFICIAMVWYLVPSSGGTGTTTQTNDVLAQVGDQDITYADVQQLFDQFHQPMSGLMVPRAVDALISNDAEVMEAHRLGLEVSDQELQDFLHRGQFGEMLFPGGKFIGDQAYTNFVAEQFHTTVEKFEGQLKQEMLTQKLENLISGSVSVTPQELQTAYVKRNTKVKLEYAVLTQQALEKQITPTDAELKAFYEQHKAEYANSIPEKRKAKYIVVDLAKLQQQQQVTPAEIQSYYDQHQEDFRRPAEVKASHILVKVTAGPDGKVDPQADAAAKAKAEGILKQLKTGANFADLAKKDSDDKASAINGGELGWFQRGQMVPEFEQVAFSLPVGQISDLVKTQFGYHIIKVEDRHQAGVAPLADVKDKIETQLKQQDAERAANTLGDSLQSEVRASGFDGAAAKHNLDVVTSDWFTRSDSLPGIGNAPDFMQAAFDAKPNAPPQGVPTQQGSVVFQITAMQPAATPTFDEIRSKVEQQYKQQTVVLMLFQKTQELSDRAHALHDLKAAAKELGAEMKTTDWLTPTSQAPDLGSMSGQASVAFTLKPGEISGPIVSAVSGATLTVTDKQEPPLSDLAKSEDELRQELIQSKRQDVITLFRAGLTERLEKQGKIKRNQQQIQALVERASLGS